MQMFILDTDSQEIGICEGDFAFVFRVFNIFVALLNDLNKTQFLEFINQISRLTLKLILKLESDAHMTVFIIESKVVSLWQNWLLSVRKHAELHIEVGMGRLGVEFLGSKIEL